MYIVLNVLGMPFNGDTLKTASLGGSETAGYYIARELARRGHRVTVFTNSPDEGVYDGVRYCFAGEQTEQTPLGHRFHLYAGATPHDVCIIQRHPQAFAFRWASKINLFWMHDLALHRAAGQVNNMLWNINGVLPVSAWHGRQLQEVFGLNPDIIYPVKNGVDLSLYQSHLDNVFLRKGEALDPIPFARQAEGKFKLLYAARPERGLENLVKPDGIMARLAKISSDYHLYFCTYDNVAPDMRDYYEQLWQWAAERGNCTNLGMLTKQELADVERQCYLYVYPTIFEDTSCIMAMECAAAGLPFLASAVGALPETCENTGSKLIELSDGQVPIGKFVEHIKTLHDNPKWLSEMQADQLDEVSRFSWERAADTFEDAINKCFAKAKSSRLAVLKHFEHVSDIYALWEYAKRSMIEVVGGTKTTIDVAVNISTQERAFLDHIGKVYAFAREGNFKQHYEAYYEYEKQRGVQYGPEVLDGNHRYESVARYLADLAPGSYVLDYGCAHGHYTVNLAKRFPHLQFVGIDIAESNIAIARKWASDDGIKNVHFHEGCVQGNKVANPSGLALWNDEPALKFDCVIAAEVLEHIANPAEVTDILCQYLKPEGRFIATTPYGPWEAIGYKEHHPWRAHLWHFERGDLRDLYGHHPEFAIMACSQGRTDEGESIGSYITSFRKPSQPSRDINWERKFAAIAPRQTVSAAMIVRDAESTIRGTLLSFADYVDEVVIGLDEKTSDHSRAIIEDCLAPFIEMGRLTLKLFPVPCPLEAGFSATRNAVVQQCTADWIFWPDADEVLVHANQLHKYLRVNQYSGYSLALRHFSVDPPGVIKTDFPAKLFRNNGQIRFYGYVHEHPETSINKGPGHTVIAHDIGLAHFSYLTEEIRRGRFERNIDLLIRDRETYPERILGKFLWLRDLAQMNQWEFEQNGHVLTEAMLDRAKAAMPLWDDLVKEGNTRLLVDALEFYSPLAKLHTRGTGIECAFKFDVSKMNGGVDLNRVREVKGYFISSKQAELFLNCLLRARTTVYESKYF